MRLCFCLCSVFSIFAIFLFSGAYSAETYGIEESFVSPVKLPTAIANAIQGKMDKGRLVCLRDAHVSAAQSLEASEVHLRSGFKTFIIKPVQPPAGAWGCHCGAANCPIWIYAVNNSEIKEIWHAPGTDAVEILDSVTQGYRDVLTSGGTAGYGYCDRSAWDGSKYKTIKSEHVTFDDTYNRRVKNGEITPFDYTCK